MRRITPLPDETEALEELARAARSRQAEAVTRLQAMWRGGRSRAAVIDMLQRDVAVETIQQVWRQRVSGAMGRAPAIT